MTIEYKLLSNLKSSTVYKTCIQWLTEDICKNACEYIV